MTEPLAELLVALLVCPQDKGALWCIETDGDQVLYNPRLKRTYPIRDGIPVLLVTEAVQVDDIQAAHLDKLIEQGKGVETGLGIEPSPK